MDRAAKEQDLERLCGALQQLEGELAQTAALPDWPPRRYYTAYHVLAGFVLGIFGAATSLLFNVVGSVLVHQYALELIRVYLTFPLGEAALRLGEGQAVVRDDVILVTGCCLYLGTGMLLGIPYHLALTRWLPNGTFASRLALVTGLSIALWLVNYYAILSWLQPVLFGGNWIVQLIPWWVAALTHLIFGWTMLLVQPLGAFVPYQPPTEAK